MHCRTHELLKMLQDWERLTQGLGSSDRTDRAYLEALAFTHELRDELHRRGVTPTPR